MALTLDGLRKLLDAAKLRYYIAPDRDAVLLNIGGVCGSYQLTLSLDLDGKFMQMRTMRYLSCPPDHPHLTETLKVLAALDYRLRLVKFAWDPADGEIVCYLDCLPEDAGVTQPQMDHMFRTFVSAVDLNFKRLGTTIETGKDPGEISDDELNKLIKAARSSPGPDTGKPFSEI